MNLFHNRRMKNQESKQSFFNKSLALLGILLNNRDSSSSSSSSNNKDKDIRKNITSNKLKEKLCINSLLRKTMKTKINLNKVNFCNSLKKIDLIVSLVTLQKRRMLTIA